MQRWYWSCWLADWAQKDHISWTFRECWELIQILCFDFLDLAGRSEADPQNTGIQKHEERWQKSTGSFAMKYYFLEQYNWFCKLRLKNHQVWYQQFVPTGLKVTRLIQYLFKSGFRIKYPLPSWGQIRWIAAAIVYTQTFRTCPSSCNKCLRKKRNSPLVLKIEFGKPKFKGLLYHT